MSMDIFGKGLLMMKTNKKTILIPAGEFKQKCLNLIDEVSKGEIELIVTKRGKECVRIVSLEKNIEGPICGTLKGSVKYNSDITLSEVENDWRNSFRHLCLDLAS